MIARLAGLEDVALVNEICGDPEVRKWTAADGSPPFDGERWIRQPASIVVLVEGGCFLCPWLGGTTWAIHTHFLPSHRGKGSIISASAALALGFLGTQAETFVTSVPDNNRGAAWFAKTLGFLPTYRREQCWTTGDETFGMQHFRLDIDEWILRGFMRRIGEEFHEALSHHGHNSHDEDPVHDSYVGTACAMVAHGKVDKALSVYNRWALASGYEPLRLKSTSPPVIDARDFLIRLEAGTMHIDPKENEHA